jgi:RNA polymerase sigma-70 factor (ECF subfamily)
MGTSIGPATDQSLLERVKGLNHTAWAVFVARYERMIIARCRWRGLQEVDAIEVSSDVWARLLRSLTTYDRERRFRGWLNVVVDNAIRDFVARMERCPGARGSGDTSVHKGLEQFESGGGAEATEAANSQLENDWEALEGIIALVKPTAEPTTWKAFWLTTVERRPPEEVAKELGIPIGSVYTYKSRILKKLKMQAAALKGGDSGQNEVHP